MAMPTETDTLSDAEILRLLRTQAPGVPPGLDHPPLPPDTLTAPPWAAHSPTTHVSRRIALAGGLGMLILWGIARRSGDGAASTGRVGYPTAGPVVVYLASAPATATAPAAPTMPLPAPPPPTVRPTLPPVLPITVPTIPPPTVPPPSATPVPVAAPPVQRPRPRPTTPPLAPTPVPPPVPAPPPAVPPPAGGSGDWGNDWSGSIFDRSATIGAPTSAPSIRP